jgi:hypothetical protein
MRCCATGNIVPQPPSSAAILRHHPARVIAIEIEIAITYRPSLSMAMYGIAIGLYSIADVRNICLPRYVPTLHLIYLSRSPYPQPRPHLFSLFPISPSTSLHPNPPEIFPPSLSDIAASGKTARQSRPILPARAAIKSTAEQPLARSYSTPPTRGPTKPATRNTTEPKCQTTPPKLHIRLLLLCCPAHSFLSIHPPDWPQPPVTHGSDSARRVCNQRLLIGGQVFAVRDGITERERAGWASTEIARPYDDGLAGCSTPALQRWTQS